MPFALYKCIIITIKPFSADKSTQVMCGHCSTVYCILDSRLSRIYSLWILRTEYTCWIPGCETTSPELQVGSLNLETVVRELFICFPDLLKY